MKKPHLEITAISGKCSSCDTYFTGGGPGLITNPEAVLQALQGLFDKHFKQVHEREDAS